MFRIFGTFLAVAGLLTTVACTALKNPVAPAGNGGTVAVSVKYSSPKAGAPVLAQAPASDFTTGIVVLTKGSITQNAPIVIANGRASASIPGLEAGVWTITLNFYNATGDLTYTGTSTVTVQNGVTASVSITIDPVNGAISFDFALPIDGSAFIGSYLYNGLPCSCYWLNNQIIFQNEGGGTSAMVSALSADEVVVDSSFGNYHAKLSADLSTITWYTPGGSLAIGTGTPWVRQ